MQRGTRGTTTVGERGHLALPWLLWSGKGSVPLGILFVPLGGAVGTFSKNTHLFTMINGWSGVSRSDSVPGDGHENQPRIFITICCRSPVTQKQGSWFLEHHIC